MRRQRRREQDPAITAAIGFGAAVIFFSVIVTYWEMIVLWTIVGLALITLGVSLVLLLRWWVISRW